MTMTLALLAEKFNYYNREMFEGRLPVPPLKLSTARSFLGQLRYKKERRLFGRWRYSDFTLVMSTRYDLEESMFDDILIHEMIHYDILYHQQHDTSAHGRLFRSKMQEINRRYGRNLSISHRLTPEERENDREIRTHYVGLIRFTNRDVALIVAAKSRLQFLRKAIPLVPYVDSCHWFISHNPYFNRYPRAQKIKFYPTTEEELSRYSLDFIPLD